ncbi:hypothetical protein GQR58_029501 [Nymphon striatum]|nr:hypothetical protein GQR58_029501 [Nymphon striatum]
MARRSSVGSRRIQAWCHPRTGREARSHAAPRASSPHRTCTVRVTTVSGSCPGANRVVLMLVRAARSQPSKVWPHLDGRPALAYLGNVFFGEVKQVAGHGLGGFVASGQIGKVDKEYDRVQDTRRRAGPAAERTALGCRRFAAVGNPARSELRLRRATVLELGTAMVAMNSIAAATAHAPLRLLPAPACVTGGNSTDYQPPRKRPPRYRHRRKKICSGPFATAQIRIQSDTNMVRKTPPRHNPLGNCHDKAENGRPVFLPPVLLQCVVDQFPDDANHGDDEQRGEERLVDGAHFGTFGAGHHKPDEQGPHDADCAE